MKKAAEVTKQKEQCEKLDKEITIIRDNRMVHLRTLERGLFKTQLDRESHEKQVSEIAIKINGEEIKLARKMKKLSELSEDEVYPEFHK